MTASLIQLFEIRNLWKWFERILALQDVDLETRRGELLGLLGKNGAGKSTLIKIVSGVHQPTAGTIRCEGQEVHISSPDVAHSLGIETVFQDLALIPNLAVVPNFFINREKTWGLFGGFSRSLLGRALEQE